nr:hypothetical protein [Tanacetum cinerariifolium]
MPPRMRAQSAGRPVAKSRGGGTGGHVGRGGKGRRPRGKGVKGGVGGAPDFSTIIAQQLQNLLPAILAQVGNQGNVRSQNGNVVNENVIENVRNVLLNSSWLGGDAAMVGGVVAAAAATFNSGSEGWIGMVVTGDDIDGRVLVVVWWGVRQR